MFQLFELNPNLKLGFTWLRPSGADKTILPIFLVIVMVGQMIQKHKTRLLKLFKKNKIEFTNKTYNYFIILEIQQWKKSKKIP